MVVGVIFLGVATPSEMAATGAMGTILLALCYGRLNGEVIQKTSIGTLTLTGMLFLILCGFATLSQVIAYSGTSDGLTNLVIGLPVSPIVVVIAMQMVILILGAFMDVEMTVQSGPGHKRMKAPTDLFRAKQFWPIGSAHEEMF